MFDAKVIQTLNPLVNVMKKASNTDSYLHILKYINLFGGVQVLNVLIVIVHNKFVAMLLGPQGSGTYRFLIPQPSSSVTLQTLEYL